MSIKSIKKILIYSLIIFLCILLKSQIHTFADGNVDNISVPFSGLMPTNFYQNGDISDMTSGRFSNTPYTISYPFIPKHKYYSYNPEIISTVPTYKSSMSGQNLKQSINYTMGSDNDIGGVGRYIEFRVKTSKDLDGSIKDIIIHPNNSSSALSDPGLYESTYGNLVNGTVGSWNPSLNSSGSFYDSDGGKVYIANSFLGNSNGGTANIQIDLNSARFIKKDSKIYTYAASNTLYPGGYSTPIAYHPVYEALRIFNSNDLNKNDQYNRKVLNDKMKDPYIKEIEDHYNNLINQIPSRFPKPKYNQEEIDSYIKKIENIKDKGIKDIKAAAKKMEDSGNYDDSIFNYFKNTADDTIRKMDKENIIPTEISILSVPNLNFGNHFVEYSDKNYKLLNSTKVSVKDVNYKKWQLNLSLGDLTNNLGNKLRANYIMNGISYNPNNTIPYYIYNSTNENINDNINIKKSPENNIKMHLFYGNDSGNYNGQAYWDLLFTPINNNSESDNDSSHKKNNSDPSTYTGSNLKSYLNGRFNGRKDGFNAGNYDSSNGFTYKQNYDDANDNVDSSYKIYKQGYKFGYSDGYDDGYYENNSLYKEDFEQGYNDGYNDGQSNSNNPYLSGYNNAPSITLRELGQLAYKSGYDKGYNYGYENNPSGNDGSNGY